MAKIIYIYQRRDGGHIGGIDQIDGEPTDIVRFGNHIITLIFTKRLRQYYHVPSVLPRDLVFHHHTDNTL